MATFRAFSNLTGLMVIEPKVFRDERGWFLEAWKHSEYGAQGVGPFVQDNHSGNLAAGIVRGLHYQLPPQAQGKLVRCVRGRVWDVAVDLRRGPTYLQHATIELASSEPRMLWIPPGFAHGYCTLEPDSEVVYKTTTEYAPSLERSLRWDDPALAIPWPTRHPVLAPKDAKAPTVSESSIPSKWG